MPEDEDEVFAEGTGGVQGGADGGGAGAGALGGGPYRAGGQGEGGRAVDVATGEQRVPGQGAVGALGDQGQSVDPCLRIGAQGVDEVGFLRGGEGGEVMSRMAVMSSAVSGRAVQVVMEVPFSGV